MNTALKVIWNFRFKLWAEGDKLWAEGIIEIYGNIKIEWKSNSHCILENGEEYKSD